MSGVKTGARVIVRRLKRLFLAHPLASVVCAVVVVGAITLGTAVYHTAAAACLRNATTTSACALLFSMPTFAFLCTKELSDKILKGNSRR